MAFGFRVRVRSCTFFKGLGSGLMPSSMHAQTFQRFRVLGLGLVTVEASDRFRLGMRV
jgi:hypothetical protein